MKRRWATLAALLAILAATALAYWPGTHGSWALDDYPNIVNNPALHLQHLDADSLLRAAFSMQSGVLDRPIAMASFALNEYFGGLQPGPMKVTNLAIHLLNGLLVFFLIRLLLDEYARMRRSELAPGYRDAAALLVAAAWLLAPINLTAVLYVVQRMTSLSATFTLGALVAYVSGRRRLYSNRGRGGGIALLLLAALVMVPLATFTKEDGALTLLYALVIEWVFFGFRNADGRPSRFVAAYYLIFLVAPGIAGALWQLPPVFHPAAWAARSFDLGQRLLTEGRVLWHYLGWTFFPDVRQLTLYHDAFPFSRGPFTPWTTLPAWGGVAVLLVAGIRLRRRLPLVSFGILWFLAGQAMTASVIPLELVFEHREYLPALGVFTAIFGTLLLAEPYARLRFARWASAVAVVLLYAAALALRSLDWSNPLLTASIAAKEHPDSPRATYEYGRVLAILSGPAPSLLPKAMRALETAAHVPGQSVTPESSLIILASRHKLAVKPEWYASIRRKLAARPPDAQDISALYSLVNCADAARSPCSLPPEQMSAIFAAALDHGAGNQDIAAIYGNYLLTVRHEPARARSIFEDLVRRVPSEALYRFDLGVTAAASGDLETAAAQLAELQRTNRLGMNDQQIRQLAEVIARAEEERQRREPRQ